MEDQIFGVNGWFFVGILIVMVGNLWYQIIKEHLDNKEDMKVEEYDERL